MKQRDVEMPRVHYALRRISQLSVPPDFTIIAFGSTHAPLRDADGYQFIFKGPAIPGFWRFIPIPQPTRFIARITETRYIDSFFKSIEIFCLTAFMIFPRKFEKLVIDDLKEAQNPFFSPIRQEPEHLIYFVDTDNPESETGITEAISVGKDIDFKDGIIFV